MLALFCLRLALGLMAALLFLSPTQLNPRFSRTHFLTTLALAAGALSLLWERPWPLRAILPGVLVLASLGSAASDADGHPAGPTLIGLALLALAAALCLFQQQTTPP